MRDKKRFPKQVLCTQNEVIFSLSARLFNEFLQHRAIIGFRVNILPSE